MTTYQTFVETADDFEVFSTAELLEMGLIDAATMQELMEPATDEVEVAA